MPSSVHPHKGTHITHIRCCGAGEELIIFIFFFWYTQKIINIFRSSLVFGLSSRAAALHRPHVSFAVDAHGEWERESLEGRKTYQYSEFEKVGCFPAHTTRDMSTFPEPKKPNRRRAEREHTRERMNSRRDEREENVEGEVDDFWEREGADEKLNT